MPEFKQSPIKTPLEGEKLAFVDRMRSEHLPLMLKSISELEKVGKDAIFSNEKINSALSKLKDSRKLLQEAQSANLPSDFLLQYREAVKKLGEASSDLAEGMDQNTEKIKRIGLISAGVVLATATMFLTRQFWMPYAAELASSSVALTTNQIERLKTLSGKLDTFHSRVSELSDETAEWRRVTTAASDLKELVSKVATSGKMNVQQANEIQEASTRVIQNSEALVSSEKISHPSVDVFLHYTEMVKYEVADIMKGAR